MGAILPELKIAKPPKVELPELTDELRQAELAAFAGTCVDDKKPGVDVCQKTQSVQEPGHMKLLITVCSGCDVRRSTACRA